MTAVQCPECRQHEVEPGGALCWWCAATDDPGGEATLPPPTFMPQPGGVVRDTWKLAARLGAGGMGFVFLAEEVSLGRTVAIKFLSDALCRQELAVKRFWREARLAARVEHAHIVPIYAVGEEGGRPFLVMKHLSGQTLADLLIERGRLSRGEAVPLLEKLAAGIDALHQAGIVHRDVKPTNVIVNAGDHPWLLDFGISTAISADPLTQVGGLIGTAGYVAPEVITGGAAAAQARSDQYAFAVLAYQLLVGALPFRASNTLAELKLKQSATFEPAGDGLDAAFARALAPKPEERFPTVSDFVAALKPRSEKPRPTRWPLALAAALLLVLLGGGAALWPRETPAVVAPVVVAATGSTEKNEPLELEGLELEVDGTTRRPIRKAKVTKESGPAELRIVTTLGGESTWARVAVDGKAAGNTPVRLVVDAGRHVIQVERPGAKPARVPVMLVPGANPVVEIRLAVQ